MYNSGIYFHNEYKINNLKIYDKQNIKLFTIVNNFILTINLLSNIYTFDYSIIVYKHNRFYHYILYNDKTYCTRTFFNIIITELVHILNINKNIFNNIKINILSIISNDIICIKDNYDNKYYMNYNDTLNQFNLNNLFIEQIYRFFYKKNLIFNIYIEQT